MLFDTHAHLDYFNSDRELIIQELIENNIKCISISTDINKVDDIFKIVKNFDNLYMSVGQHPDHIKDGFFKKEEIVKVCKNYGNKVKAIGETGLDYIKKTDEEIALQKKSFREHIEACIELNLPVVVHSRDAEQGTMEILSEYKNMNLKGIMHCFTGSLELMNFALEMGFYISFSGIVTFKNAKNVFEAMINVPNDKILLETDSPYLAPVPHRGERNRPLYVKHVYDFVMNNKNISKEEITSNAFRVFDID